MKNKRNTARATGMDDVDTALVEAVEIVPEPESSASKRDKRDKRDKHSGRRRRGWGFLLGAGIGAAAMYLLDPRDGARRRALVRDKATRYSRLARENLSGRIEDARQRSGGMMAELRSQFRLGSPTNEVLLARVRSRLGHVVSHPAAIEVSAQDGRVTLRGPILMSEVDHALMAVRLIPGVTEVANQLEPHESADGIPGLQGQSAPLS
jgi:osmotically-inducible protein OsmY